HAVLERGVEAGEAVEPVEGQRPAHVGHVQVRSALGGERSAPEVLDTLARERLIAGEEIRERPAGEIVGWTRARRVTRLQRREPGEGIALGEQYTRTRGGFRLSRRRPEEERG